MNVCNDKIITQEPEISNCSEEKFNDAELNLRCNSMVTVVHTYSNCKYGDGRRLRKKLKCEVCNIKCANQRGMDAHLKGRRHKHKLKSKNIDREGEVYVCMDNHLVPVESDAGVRVKTKEVFLDVESKLQPILVELAEREPLIGLESVFEKRYSSKTDPMFVCKLCQARFQLRSVSEHLIGQKHRLNFLKEYNYQMFCEITEDPAYIQKKPDELNQILKIRAASIMDRFGGAKNIPSIQVVGIEIERDIKDSSEKKLSDEFLELSNALAQKEAQLKEREKMLAEKERLFIEREKKFLQSIESEKSSRSSSTQLSSTRILTSEERFESTERFEEHSRRSKYTKESRSPQKSSKISHSYYHDTSVAGRRSSLHDENSGASFAPQCLAGSDDDDYPPSQHNGRSHSDVTTPRRDGYFFKETSRSVDRHHSRDVDRDSPLRHCRETGDLYNSATECVDGDRVFHSGRDYNERYRSGGNHSDYSVRSNISYKRSYNCDWDGERGHPHNQRNEKYFPKYESELTTDEQEILRKYRKHGRTIKEYFSCDSDDSGQNNSDFERHRTEKIIDNTKIYRRSEQRRDFCLNKNVHGDYAYEKDFYGENHSRTQDLRPTQTQVEPKMSPNNKKKIMSSDEYSQNMYNSIFKRSLAPTGGPSADLSPLEIALKAWKGKSKQNCPKERETPCDVNSFKSSVCSQLVTGSTGGQSACNNFARFAGEEEQKDKTLSRDDSISLEKQSRLIYSPRAQPSSWWKESSNFLYKS